jgi:hypothetical protein
MPETEKTKPNPNRNKLKKKPSQTGKNRAKLKKLSQTGFFLKNRTELKSVGLNRFWFFFKKIWLGYYFLIKTKPNRK